MVDFHRIVRAVRERIPIGRPAIEDGSRLPAMSRQPTIQPILPVGDLAVASVFWRRLGFTVTAYDDGYAWVSHCGWEVFHLRRVDDHDPEANRASAYLHVVDADAWRVAMAAPDVAADVGATRDEPWGMREFAVIDPAGNLVRFGHHL